MRRHALIRICYAVLGAGFISITSAQAKQSPTLSEIDLAQVQINGLQLGMSKATVERLLKHQFSHSEQSKDGSVAAFKCVKTQCQAQRNAADGETLLNVYFNRQQQAHWIVLQSQAQLAETPKQCLEVAAEQLDALRQKYHPEDLKHFYGPNAVTLRLNKQGHPDPADNSFYGYRVQIKCESFGSGVGSSEYELRDKAIELR
ncbi:hypothetical protein LMJ53_06860 [Rheinheimera sp. UJ51]|uniref:hypothetical protein n=1 Tax=Rheinheimera sp. UJ51 TaxID=2892446 RepID=UPI001E38785A|nr:hypothetical protein [Rheinheimera sp. UJ51]MCC5451455.1 hypothetical protein [Rheinheimera sp. UJ51]